MTFTLSVSPISGVAGTTFIFTVTIADISGADKDVTLTLEGKTHDSITWGTDPSVPAQTKHIDINGNLTTTFSWTTPSNQAIDTYNARVHGVIGAGEQYTNEVTLDIIAPEVKKVKGLYGPLGLWTFPLIEMASARFPNIKTRALSILGRFSKT